MKKIFSFIFALFLFTLFVSGVLVYSSKAKSNSNVNNYEGFIISIDHRNNKILFSASCTELDSQPLICSDVNPPGWQLWKRFINLFRDPSLVEVSVNNSTSYELSDYFVSSDFNNLRPHTFIKIKGSLKKRSWFGLGKLRILAKKITVSPLETQYGRFVSTGLSKNTKVLNLEHPIGSISIKIKAYITKNTLMVDTENKVIPLNNLSFSDVLSVQGRQFRWYNGSHYGEERESFKELDIIAEKVILLGKTTKEGEEVKTIFGDSKKIDLGNGVKFSNVLGRLVCEKGLTEVLFPDDTVEWKEGEQQKVYCVNCGDGTCKIPETENNCPRDCFHRSWNIGDGFSFIVAISRENFNPEKGYFYGVPKINGKNVLDKEVSFVLSNDSKFYKVPAGEQNRKYWKETDMLFLKAYSTSDGPGPKRIKIKGTIIPSEEENKISVKVDEVLMFIQ